MSNPLRPYVGDTKLVIAFDIGTTFSGVSYCILERGVAPEILGVTQFAGQAQVSGDAKVPSLLYYDNSGRVRAAGAEAATESVVEAAMTEEWTKAEWWKLHLCPNHLAASVNKDHDLPPLPPGKTAVQVLADFIKYLFRCAKAYIEERRVAFSWSSVEGSTEYIFTHPNGWEAMQPLLYRRAIELAGLVPSTPDGRSRIHMLTEGEASLHFCIANLVNVESTSHGAPQGVVVIDAGGGTVDLSMFRMTSNPISCEEIAPADCRLQGSVFVTRRARVLLERKLEGWEHCTAEEITEFTREFDQTTKLVIASDQEPAYTKVASPRCSKPKYGIRFGKLKWTGKEATSLFDESIDAIIGTFEQQQKSSEVPITMVFLVGGLSTNAWVWSQLQSHFKRKNIMIFRPDNHINKAVANGAVLSHVDPDNHTVTARVAGATYGLVCSVPANKNDAEHVDRESHWERDPRDECYVPGHFEVKLSKGDKVTEEMEFRESFSLTENDPINFSVQIVRLGCYRGNICDPVKWVDQDLSSFFSFCTVYADLSQTVNDLTGKKTPSGQMCYQLDYDVIVCFGLAEIQAYLCWKALDGERRIPAMVSFEDSALHVDEGLRQPRKAHQTETSEDGAQSSFGDLYAEITALRTDNEMLRRDTIVVSAQLEELKQLHDAQSKELESAKKELKAKALMIEERDRCITSFTTQVVALQRSDAEKAKQTTIARQEYGKLQKDSSFRIGELQKSCDSDRSELQARRALVEDKDRTITRLTAYIEKSKLADAIKTEQLHAEEKEKLQGDIASLSSKVDNLQVCCDVRSTEIVSLRKEVRTKATLLVEKDNTIASLTLERDLARREDAVKAGLVTSARRDADLLWQKLCDAWDKNAVLEQRFHTQLVALDHLQTELSRTKLWAKEQGADVSDSELAEYVARMLQEKEDHMEELRRTLAVSVSRNNDLKKSQEGLLGKLSALSDELAVKTSECEGSEDVISYLTVQINQLRVADADKTDQLATALDELQALRLEVTTVTAQFTDLQGRHVIQSKEIIYVNNRLRSMTLSTEETDRTILHLSTQCDQHVKQTGKHQQESSVRNGLEHCKSTIRDKADGVAVPKSQVEEPVCVNTVNDERLMNARKQIADLQQELANCRSQINTLSTERDYLRDELWAAEVADNATISSLKTQVREWKQKCNALKSENPSVATDNSTTTGEKPKRPQRDQTQGSPKRKPSIHFESVPRTVTSTSTSTSLRTRRFSVPARSSGAIENSLFEIQHLHRQENDHILLILKVRLEEYQQREQVYIERFGLLEMEREELVQKLNASTTEITMLKIRLSFFEANQQGPTQSYDGLDSSVTTITAVITTITAVITTITAVTTQIEQWKDTVFGNKGNLTLEKTDLDQLSLSLSNASAQLTKLQRDYGEVSKEFISVRRRLEMTLSLCNEKDRTIEFITEQDAAKGQQIIVLRRDNDSLRRDVSTLTAETGVSCQNSAVSYQLAAAREELKKRAKAIEEKEYSISSLQDDVARLERSEATKTREITTLRKDYETLQRDWEEIAELRKRCATLTKERDNARNERDESRSLVDSKDRTITTLKSEVARLKCDLDPITKRQGPTLQEKEELQKKLAASASELSKIQEAFEVQSKEIVSLRGKLQIKETLLSEQEHVITSITAKRDELKRKVVATEELVASTRQNVEQLQQEVSVVRNEKADLQGQLEAQLIELNNLRDERDL